MGSCNLPIGHDPRMWNSSLRFAVGIFFPPNFRVDLLDGPFPTLSFLFPVLDEIRDHYTDASLPLFLPRDHTSLQRTFMRTIHLLVSLGPRAPWPSL